MSKFWYTDGGRKSLDHSIALGFFTKGYLTMLSWYGSNTLIAVVHSFLLIGCINILLVASLVLLATEEGDGGNQDSYLGRYELCGKGAGLALPLARLTGAL